MSKERKHEKKTSLEVWSNSSNVYAFISDASLDSNCSIRKNISNDIRTLMRCLALAFYFMVDQIDPLTNLIVITNMTFIFSIIVKINLILLSFAI